MSITDRYMARVFGFYVIGLLTLLVVVLQMLDLLSRSDEIMAAPGASFASMARYAMLRAPQFLIKFTPFAVLIAMLLSMMQLAVGSEIIALRSTGMAPTRIVKPFLFVALLIAIAHFSFTEFIGVPANAQFTKWEEAGFSNLDAGTTAKRENIWYQFDGQFLHVDNAVWGDRDVRLSDFALYAIDQNGLLEKYTEAQSAVFQNGSWKLYQARNVASGALDEPFVAEMNWSTSLDPASLLNETTAIAALPLASLHKRISDMQASGVPTLRERTSFFARFSSSFASLIMPFLGLFVGLAIPRAGKFAVFLAAGLGIGFVFFTFDNMGIALGNLGVLPPLLATFFAPVSFLFGGILFMFSKEI
jgi:lipopolysaccharide export system permease protein